MSIDKEMVWIRTIVPIDIIPKLLEDGLPREIINFFGILEEDKVRNYELHNNDEHTTCIRSEYDVKDITKDVVLNIQTNLKRSDLCMQFEGGSTHLLRTLISNRNILHAKGVAEIVDFDFNDTTTQGELQYSMNVIFKRNNVIIAENWRFLEYGSGMLLKPNEDAYLDRFGGSGEELKFSSETMKKITARCEELFRQKTTANLGAGIVEELMEEYLFEETEVRGAIMLIQKKLSGLRVVANILAKAKKKNLAESREKLMETINKHKMGSR